MKIPLVQRFQSRGGVGEEALLGPFSSPLQLSPLLGGSHVKDRHTPCTYIPISSWDPLGRCWEAGGRKTLGSLCAVTGPMVRVVLRHPNSVALGQASALSTSELLSFPTEIPSEMGWGKEPGVQLCSYLPMPLYMVEPLGIFALSHPWSSLIQGTPGLCSVYMKLSIMTSSLNLFWSLVEQLPSSGAETLPRACQAGQQTKHHSSTDVIFTD